MPRPVYDRARYLRMRPPLWCGGHAFILLGTQVEWCMSCYQAVPRWAVSEGFWPLFIGRWCPGLLAALEPARDGP